MDMTERVLAWSYLNNMTLNLINVTKVLVDMTDAKKPGADQITKMLRRQIELTEEALKSSRSAFSGKED